MYTTRERKRIKEAQGSVNKSVEKMERKWLISLLYKLLDQVKGITQEQLDRVIEQYPIIQLIYVVVHGF